MSQRTLRVNELLKREISDVLHTRYRSEAVRITIAEVDTSPNLRNADVYYSVLGGAEQEANAQLFFDKCGKDIARQSSRKIVLKYFPKIRFILDHSMERGARLIEIMEELDPPE